MERSETAEQIRQVETPSPFSWYNLALPLSERRALLIGGDFVIGILSALVAFWVWQRIYPQSVNEPWSVKEQIRWLSLLGVTWLVLIGVNEGYNLRVVARSSRVARVLVLSALELAFLYLLAFFVWGRPSWRTLLAPSSTFSTLPRLTPAIFMLISPLLSLVWRLGYAALFTSALLRRRAIVVGCGAAGLALVWDIRQVAFDYEIVGFVDDDPAKRGQRILGLPVLGDSHSLVRLIQQMGANEVVLAIARDIHPELFRALMDCHEMGVEIRPMPVVYEELLERVPVDYLGQRWFLAPFWTQAGMPTFYRSVKRLVDIVLALVGLGVFGMFLPLIALANFLESRGPLFYRHARVGKGGRIFWVYKLRSTTREALGQDRAIKANGLLYATRVGRVLRWTRLDELPQLVNVLKGEMSIVGPHPESPQLVQPLQEKVPFYRARLSVKPGLTGWAQINYQAGDGTDDASIKLQYDLYYIKRQSLLLDALIMLRTIKVILSFRGT
jgi:exopolysaccharide biosynthesis polyprenyl glycosylphosphotransferase